MKKKGKIHHKNEDDSEEWCFECKDGGDLIICDHKDCLKSYHPECVKLDDSFAKSDARYICKLHKCYACSRTSNVQCYGCPKGVCRRCIEKSDVVYVRGKKGFCYTCLKLTLLVEEEKDVDSDGERIDFNDRETYETLYKEYWEIINTTEKLSLETLIAANAQFKSGKNYSSDEYDDSFDEKHVSDFEENDDIKSHELGKKRKRSEEQPCKTKVTKGEIKSKQKEFTGWGSKHLMQFLTAIGMETTHALSQRELETIIKGYAKEKKLLLSNKNKKTVECDIWLQSIFRRKTVKFNRIYDLLENHLAENQEPSDVDELGYGSKEEDDDGGEALVACSKKKKDNVDKMIQQEEALLKISRFYFAAIVPENIRLVYLRRTLVQQLEKEPETFESKVMGCFVRVKEDVSGCFPKSSYQLMQVTGIRKCLVRENNHSVVLEALGMDIFINALSDDDFSEEECQELRNKVKSGLLNKLPLVEFEQKAKTLHEDIVKHWIPRELNVLKHRIDQANEKGWRRELYEYLERRQFLQNPKNQSKLLEKVPNVVPDVEEVGPIEESIEDDKRSNKDSPKSILMHTSRDSFKDNENASEKTHEVHASIVEERKVASETLATGRKLPEFYDNLAPEDRQVNSTTPLFKSQQVIQLDIDDEKSTINLSKEDLEDTESSLWYVRSSNGVKSGPVSLSVLKNWSQTDAALGSKIYKSSQSEEEAIPLTSVIHLAFPKR